MENVSDHKNSRVEELDFLIDIMSDLAYHYKEHNENLLKELISNLSYRREKEVNTLVSKYNAEHPPEYQHVA